LQRKFPNGEYENKYRLKLSQYLDDAYSKSEHSFDISLVDSAINELKLGKAAGPDRLTAEHFKYCHPIVTNILVKLFNLMLFYGYVPDGFGDGLTFPIPKSSSNKHLLSSNDFRGKSNYF
jgi:hypothetical protein